MLQCLFSAEGLCHPPGERAPLGRIRILLAGDHTVVRAGLRALLNQQPDMEVVGEADRRSGRDCKGPGRFQPDMLVMDIAMPGTTGLEATRQIRLDSPDVRILLLTMFTDEQCFFQSIQAGASRIHRQRSLA